jgi:hypothetical protein
MGFLVYELNCHRKNSEKKNIQGNFLTTIFDLSKNDTLCDLIMMHKCRVFDGCRINFSNRTMNAVYECIDR